MTEQTKDTDREGRNGWVLYDGDCPMCIRLAGRFASILSRHGFDLEPLQSPWVRFFDHLAQHDAQLELATRVEPLDYRWTLGKSCALRRQANG